MRSDVTVERARNSPHIDAPVFFEILVFSGEQRVAQSLRKLVITDDHAALDGERTHLAALVVVDFCNCTGPVVFELANLRKIGGVNDQQPYARPNQGGGQHQQAEQHSAD